jgi:hypothetical protein
LSAVVATIDPTGVAAMSEAAEVSAPDERDAATPPLTPDPKLISHLENNCKYLRRYRDAAERALTDGDDA